MNALRWLMGGQCVVAAVQAVRHWNNEEYASAVALACVMSVTMWIWVYAEQLYKRRNES